ncbi:hypothetical protein ACVRZ8_01580 [Streptococcus dentiloxodontae]
MEEDYKRPSKLGLAINWFFKLLIKLITAPVIVILWCWNFLKSILGVLIFWIFGKTCFHIIVLLLFGGLAQINLITFETAEKWLDWWSIHVTNLHYQSSESGWMFFPYPKVEIWIILALIIFVATAMTKEALDRQRMMRDEY